MTRSVGPTLRVLLLVLITVLATPVLAAASPTLDRLEKPDVLGPPEPPAGWAEPPPVTADAFVLVAAESGQVLAARAAQEPMVVASTVKILTAISVLRRLDPDTIVTAGPEVDGLPSESATVGLAPGERWAVEDLLEGLIARSGNDAARALATATSGSTEKFVEQMRSDAAALGLAGVEVHTPTGLEDRNRLSATHLAVLARLALRDPLFRAVAARDDVTLPDMGTVASRNELLATYPGAYGVKTGYTNAAGRCLVAAARRDGRDLIVVVLGSDGPTDHFEDARRLLDYGFERFESVAPAPLRLRVPGDWILLGPAETDVLVPTGSRALRWEVDVPLHPTGHGRLRVMWNGDLLADLDLFPVREPPLPMTIGTWLADRSYTAMRAATVSGLWRTAAGLSDNGSAREATR